MKKKYLSSLLIITFVFVSSLVFAGCVKNNSKFVMLDDAKKIQELNEDQAMYQTKSSLDEVLAFYREKMTAKGLVERGLLTVQSGTTLNLVFDGSENGKAFVVQAVTLDENTTNVTVRFEGI